MGFIDRPNKVKGPVFDTDGLSTAISMVYLSL